MRGRGLLLTLLGLFCLCGTALAQAPSQKVYGGDSLAGFDEQAVGKMLQAEGVSGDKYKLGIEIHKRNFLALKYDLYEKVPTEIPKDFVPNQSYSFKPLGGSANINTAPCVNEGFEMGNLTGWNITSTLNANSCAYPIATNSGTNAVVFTTPFNDTYAGTVTASPFTGNKVVRINDGNANYGVTRISQTFPVTSSNYLYEFAYKAVMATSHSCCEQTFMRVNMRVGNTLWPCPQYTFAPPPPSGTQVCSYPGISWTPTVISGYSVAFNPTWQKYSLDLTGMIGNTITIEVTVGDCIYGAHFGYVYYDSQCSSMGVTLNNTLMIPAEHATLNAVGVCGQTATLSAPGGLNPYRWLTPSGSTITTQSVSSSVPGNYTLEMNPPGACQPIVRVVNLSFAPPVTVAVTPTLACSGSNATLTASGASTYTWNTFQTGSVITVTPNFPFTYSVTAASGSCVGTFTTFLDFALTPTLNLAASSTTVCANQQVTLTATGATNYTWLPMGTTGSVAVDNPSVSTTYTAIGTNTAGCTTQQTINIGIGTPPSLFAINATGSVCAGNPAFAVASGALSYTWLPSGQTGNTVNLTPSVTTNYTIIGAIGNCTASTSMVTVVVDPGPVIGISTNTALICPGNTAVLTASSTSAVGYTWTPGGTTATTLAITPTATANYSVTGINNNGCRSTYTITQLVAPVPTIVIAPPVPSVCIGSTINLVASGGSSFTWSPGPIVSATAAVSPSVNSTYTVAATNGTCASTRTIAVTAVPVPTVLLSGSGTICAGSNATMIATGAANYTWMPGPLNTSMVVVSPPSTRVYTVTGELAGCSSTAMKTLTVFALPNISASASPSAICFGTCPTIIYAPTGGLSYTYSPSIATCPSVSTTYTVSGTDANSCVNNGTFNVIVNPLPTLTVTASTPSICSGSTANFTVAGGASYTWQPVNQTGAVITVTPAASTVYTVTGVSAAGCLSTRTVALNVIQTPTVSASVSPTAICIGGAATLNGLGAANFTWLPGPIPGNGVTVSPSSSTTYTLIGTTSGCTGTTTVMLVVNPLPVLSAVASPTGICPGGVSTLSSSGASTYTWNPGTMPGISVTVSPSASQVYTVSATSSLGCVSSRTVNLTVHPVPTIAIAPPTNTLCSGAAISMTASGGTAYTWNPSGSTSSVISVTPAITTAYSVTGVNIFGCSSGASKTITVISTPTLIASVTPTAVCAGSPVTLSVSGASNYTWQPGGNTAPTFTLIPTVTSTFAVTGSSGGCTTSVSGMTVVVHNPPAFTAIATPTSICPGNSSTLSANGAVTYTWLPGSGFSTTHIVSPSATTVYTVTGASAFGCSSTRTVNLVVNPAPTIIASPSSTTICSGSGANLTVTGANTYTWLPGPSFGASVSFSPATSTTYTVNGTSTLGCPGFTTVQVNVNNTPTIIISSSANTVCAGSCATLTANGAASYAWSNGITGSLAVVCPTLNMTYTVMGTSNGCTATATRSVAVDFGPTLTAAANPTAICIGASATLTSSGASNYNWVPGPLNGPSHVVTPLISTTYTLTGTNTLGCMATRTVAVVVNPLPTLSITPVAATICPGQSTLLTASGGTAYSWNPSGATTSTLSASPTITTVYTVTGVSASGCTGTRTVQVTVAPVPVLVTTSSPSVMCVGNSSTLSVTGANSYTWSTTSTATSIVVSPITPTVYTVIGSNGQCTASANASVMVTPLPTLSIAASQTAICPGGSVTFTGSGAAIYNWMPGSATGSVQTFSPSASAIYTLTGTNVFSCTATRTVGVIVNPVPTVSVSPSAFTICPGGFVTLAASGASTYVWQPGGSNQSTLSAGPASTTVYTVTGTSSLGCTGTATANVFVAPRPNLTITATPSFVCTGGSSTLNVSGATSYTWGTGASGSSIVITPPSTSVYVVTGSNGLCTTVTAVTVAVMPNPVVFATGSPTSICPGGTSSLVAGNASTYVWQPGGATQTMILVTPPSSQVYTVTGTNSLGCKGNATVAVQVNPSPNIGVTATPTSVCLGQSAVLTATGAASYTWLPVPSTGSSATVTPTSATVYTVNGTSAFNCPGSATVSVGIKSLPSVTVAATPSMVCPGGTSTLTASGASTYSWNTGGTGSPIVVNTNTTSLYTVTATAVNGCSVQGSAVVVVNQNPTVTALATQTAICPGFTSTLSASGASTYVWQPGGSTGSVLAVSPAATQVYTVTGTSSLGCTGSVAITVSVLPSPTLVATANPTLICAGAGATLSATGATSFTWLPGPAFTSTTAVTPLTTTNYTVTGAIGPCSQTAAVQVSVNPVPVVSVTALPSAICPGGTSTLTATGAAGFSWSPGGQIVGTITVSPSASAVYTVTGTTNGCSKTETVAVNVNSVPSISIAANPNPLCSGNSATLIASGTLNYSWSPGGSPSATLVVSPTTNQSYTVLGTNGAGCSNTMAVTVTVNATPTVVATALNNSVCTGFTTSLSATGASNYTWQPGPLNGSLVPVTVTSTAVYTVTGEDNGCISTSTVAVTELTLPAIGATANPSVLCIGDITTITATGAVTYTWLPSLNPAASFTDNPASSTVYTVAGQGANGCPNIATVSVTVLPQPTVSIISSPAAVCSGSTATLTASGANTYTWMPGSHVGTTMTVNPTSQTSYSVQGQTGSCLASASITLSVNPLPVVSAMLTNTDAICAGGNASLSATGALNYTWLPTPLTGSDVVDQPKSAIVYTVVGQDANGCENTALVTVTVNPLPVLLPVATPTGVCDSGTFTLTVSGANSYTWMPGTMIVTTFTDAPLTTTTYTVDGTDSNGCIGTETVTAFIFPTPTVVVTPLNSTICAGTNVTLTAGGATGYTWMPGGATGSVLVDSPLSSTVYTITGDNGGICVHSATAEVIVTPAPSGVTANSNGTITCSAPSATITGTSADPNLSFSWSGPGGFSSTSSSTVVSTWGIYTLTVTDPTTGCSSSATVDVPTDNSIPSVTATSSGSITCAANTVTLDAANTTFSAGIAWSGPGGFTGTAQTETVSAPGVYTVVVTDLISTCATTAFVTVNTHTQVQITSSISPATCSLGMSNNDGTIMALNFGTLDRFDLVAGTSYTGSATYTSAVQIPTNGVLTGNLANPSSTVAFTVRYFDSEGCTKDTTLILVPVDCVPKMLGIAKAVSVPTLNTDGTYNVRYTVVVANRDAAPVTGVSLTDRLDKTFPSPATFTVSGAPVAAAGSSLSVNSSFDGVLQSDLLLPGASTLNANSSDTVTFMVRINPNGFFGPFMNTANGLALTSNSVMLQDSSQTGLNADPDADGNPNNNNVPTTLTLTPNVFFGLTKVGEFNRLDNNTFNVSYTISVHNLGNDTLRNVVVKDSLLGTTIKTPATYSLVGGPVASGMLAANASFNGGSDPNLLVSGSSKMAPGIVSQISFTINVVPDSVTVLVNSATGEVNNGAFKDVSNDGTDPDSNNNGVWNEAEDNVPTVLVLPSVNNPTLAIPTTTLFIPGGFSPDGDGINDVFEIKGLSNTSENTITIFNRWGNRVFHQSNYSNNWNGYPNIAGTLGKDRLPQGTYYFILEMKDSGKKPITGFIVLQY